MRGFCRGELCSPASSAQFSKPQRADNILPYGPVGEDIIRPRFMNECPEKRANAVRPYDGKKFVGTGEWIDEDICCRGII